MKHPDTDWGVYLPTAGSLIGWADLGLTIVEVIITVVALFNVNFLTAKAIGSTTRTEKEWEALKIVIAVVISFYFMVMVGHLVSTILLIIAIREEIRYLLLPWLITNPFLIIVRTLILLYALIVATSEYYNKVLHFLVNTVCFSILMWMWLVIFSLYRHYRDRD